MVLKEPFVPGLTGKSGISGNNFESYGTFTELKAKFKLTIRTELFQPALKNVQLY